MALKIFELDATLQGVQGQIWDRVNGYKWWKNELDKNEGGIDKFAEGFRTFGFNRNEDDDGYTYREWLPNAKQVFLIGEFNFWQNATPLENEGFGRWAVQLPDQPDGSPRIPHMCQLKIRIETCDGQWIERVPAWTKLAWQDPNTMLFNGVFWEPPSLERYRFKHPRPKRPGNLKIYEAHVGMSSSFPQVATYLDFAENVLPRIKRMGYNAVQLMAVAEHAHYGCFGYHVTSFFAPASRSGTPEELKELVDKAHSLGIIVLMDLVHAHCSANSMDGIAMMDGTDHCYTHGGLKGHQSAWDSKIFHLLKYEVLRFMLSNVRWWLEEYGFDGFRFDGITSMLYHSHGIGKGYTGGYHEYFGPDADIESHIYLMLANDLIHSIVPSAVTVGEDVSGMPTLCLPVEDGGFGFDYRLAMAIPDMFIKMLKESTDDRWDMEWICHTLTNRRWKEKCIAYVESHDQAIVGDKTIAFWLMDAEMYTGMSLVATPQPSMCIDRGLALHKMIRLLVLGLGGEGYLNFMGNEFGHPEWIDFPRPQNGWSYQHCRRRWDLADEEHLRYRFFQAFDELMNATENRFPWLESENQFVVAKHPSDKVIAFERGDCLFVFNFHPCQSFEDYQIGMQWNEPMRCVLDSDEGRFGGHMRLEYGHGHPFQAQAAAQSRAHSVKMYLPCRTAQVLVRESLLKGGITLNVDQTLLTQYMLSGPSDLSILIDGETTPRKFGKEPRIQLLDKFCADFTLLLEGKEVKNVTSLDGKYRCYFPGHYALKGLGFLEVLPATQPPKVPQSKVPDAQPAPAPVPAAVPPQVPDRESTKEKVAADQGSKAEVPNERPAAPLQRPEASTPAPQVAASAPAAPAPAPQIAAPAPVPPEPQAIGRPPAATEGESNKSPASLAPAIQRPPMEATPPESAAAEQPSPKEKQQVPTEKQQVPTEKQQAPNEKQQAPSERQQSPKEQQLPEMVVAWPQPPSGSDAPPVAVETVPEEGERRDPREMVRCYSGLHLFGDDDRKTEEAQVGSPEEVSQLLGDACTARIKQYQEVLDSIGTSLPEFSKTYQLFGLQPSEGQVWTFCEWIPGIKAAFLIGEFNEWDKTSTPLKPSDTDPEVWSCEIKEPVSAKLTNGSKFKLYVVPSEGDVYYPPSAWTTGFVYTPEIKILDPVVAPVSAPKQIKRPPANPDGEKVYECHLGLAWKQGGAPGFKEAEATLLPRAARNGYTSILVIGVQECKEYSSMGMVPVTLFAPARDLGAAEEFQSFVAKAHSLGLRVLLSIAHDGAASCVDGLSDYYFSQGMEAFHPQSGSRGFAYDEPQVMRYLLSNLRYWIDEYGIDGFRFQNVSSMLYTTKGFFVPDEPTELEQYIAGEGKVNNSAVTYLMMANALVHELVPGAVTIADEFTGFPGLCEDVGKGGLGFNYRQVDRAPHVFHHLVNTRKDEGWSVSELIEAVSVDKNRRPNEKILGSMESSEHCAVARRPLKIAMLSWETLHTIAAGGVAPHVTELAAALHEAGHDVHIFTRGTQMHTWEHKIWGVNYHEVAFGTSPDFVQEIGNMCSAFVGRVCHVEGHIGVFDLIHGHDWLVGPAIIQLKEMGKRCIFTMHSTETGRCGNVQYGGQSARIRDIEGHTCHVADRVIAVSGVLKGEVCSHYNIHAPKVEVIYNGIHAQGIANMEWHDDWSGNTKRDKGFEAMDPMFLFVGRLAVQKGPDLLIEAIPDILQCRGDAKFLIVGDGHMRAQLQGRVDQLGIGHAVHFAGSVKSGSAHLKALFKACDAVIVPSRNEPFGIVVLEAWAAGKPVVATTSGGPRDFVKGNREGYLVDPNPGSIAWGCRQICENFDRAQQMGKLAKVKALTEFSWGHISRQTLQVYYEQLGLHGAPHRRAGGANCPLASCLLGPHKDQMGVMNQSILTMRGLSYLKLLRLLTASLGSDATLTWMGSEFGHLTAVDMPRPANGDAKQRIPYDLADEKGLKYKHLEMFEMCLNRMEESLKWLATSNQTMIVEDEQAKVMAFARGNCVFVFNFHPTTHHRPYKLEVPAGLQLPSVLKLALSTDETRFGGTGELADAGSYRSSSLAVDLSPRTALILVSPEASQKLSTDQALKLRAVDEFVDKLAGA